MDKNAYLEEVKALRDENERLREELASLRQDFNTRSDLIRRAYSVSILQAKVLAALSTGEIMTRERLARLCSRGDEPNPRNVDCQIKRIRRRLPPEIGITSVYGAGYVLEGRNLQAVRDAMRSH